MGEINLSQREKDALAAINSRDLNKRVDKAISEERIGDLALLPLDACGPYVSAKLSNFRCALADHSQAKSDRKRAQTSDALRRAAHNLIGAVGQMQQRMEDEEKERQLFQIDDRMMHPLYFSDELSVRVGYRWRKTVSDEWTRGGITFTHFVDSHPDFRLPIPKRKPSAAKRARELQDKRCQAWEYLMRSALYTVRDFFQAGGDGSAIPDTFPAVVDPSGCLNNHSLRFWQKASEP